MTIRPPRGSTGRLDCCLLVGWLVGWLVRHSCLLAFFLSLTSQQHASVSQRRICEDKFTCYHTEIEVADPTFHLTQSQYTDAGPTSPSAGPITPGAWQGSHWSANVLSHWYDSTWKTPKGASGIRTPNLSALEADALTTRPRGGRPGLREVRALLQDRATPGTHTGTLVTTL